MDPAGLIPAEPGFCSEDRAGGSAPASPSSAPAARVGAPPSPLTTPTGGASWRWWASSQPEGVRYKLRLRRDTPSLGIPTRGAVRKPAPNPRPPHRAPGDRLGLWTGCGSGAAWGRRLAPASEPEVSPGNGRPILSSRGELRAHVEAIHSADHPLGTPPAGTARPRCQLSGSARGGGGSLGAVNPPPETSERGTPARPETHPRPTYTAAVRGLSAGGARGAAAGAVGGGPT